MPEMAGINPSVPPSGAGCVECDATGGWWFHLRRCAECGHIGCCDTSPSQHATAHAKAADHPLIKSYEPGETWFWNYTDDGFGVHLAFFNRTPAEARMRILEGRRRQVEERREGLREAVARASNSIDRYTRQLHQLGLESSEREVKWLNDVIAAERTAQGRAEQP